MRRALSRSEGVARTDVIPAAMRGASSCPIGRRTGRVGRFRRRDDEAGSSVGEATPVLELVGEQRYDHDRDTGGECADRRAGSAVAVGVGRGRGGAAPARLRRADVTGATPG
jgi:hypothetical protein